MTEDVSKLNFHSNQGGPYLGTYIHILIKFSNVLDKSYVKSIKNCNFYCIDTSPTIFSLNFMSFAKIRKFVSFREKHIAKSANTNEVLLLLCKVRAVLDPAKEV